LARFFFEHGGSSYRAVIGVDEVGRGALFGPVTVGAVLLGQAAWQALPSESWFASVKDSKLVKKPEREKLAVLLEAALPCAVAHVSVRYIDRHNINAAIRYGIYRAVQSLLRRTGIAAHEIRIVADGNYRFAYPAVGMTKPMPRIDAYVKADQKYFPVSAASIVAKVRRDSLVERAAMRFPGYGLERHAGYGTAAHRAAIAKLGETAFHRKSFRGKAQR
jgi:ribonuclease HII